MELKSDNSHEDYCYSKQQKQKEEEIFHVLAVDDSLIDRKLLEKLLKVSSFKVTCVDSGDEALKYLGLVEDDDFDKKSTSSCAISSSTSSPQLLYQQDQGSKVNLIMTDYCMPGMSGYDLLKRVKGSSCKDVPVVVMSSENVPSRISMCLEEGAEEFLIKPLQLSDLKRLQSYHSCDQSTREDHNFTANSSDVRKRKAEALGPSERTVPKTKGLAVV